MHRETSVGAIVTSVTLIAAGEGEGEGEGEGDGHGEGTADLEDADAVGGGAIGRPPDDG